MAYIPLHNHSQYSILDSTASPSALAEKAKEYSMSALALTDQGNLYGAVDFYKACKSQGVKPIIGCEIWLSPGSRHEKKRVPGQPNGFPLVLIAKNDRGYQNLCKLSSLGFLEGFYYQPRIDKELLAAHAEGLFCLSGPRTGLLGHLILHGTEEKLASEIAWFQQTFGERFYFELQRHVVSEDALQLDESWLLQAYRENVAAQDKVNAALLSWSKRLKIPCVATTDVHYIEQSDWRAHEILLNIQSGEPCEIWERDSQGNAKAKVPNPKREVYPARAHHFKSPREMETLFADLPEALAATVHIAEQCHWELDFKTKHYPVFIPPALEGKSYTKEERLKAAEQFLQELCQKNIARRYTPDKLAAIANVIPGKDPMQMVNERCAYELSILTSKGMSDYMLIVYDFIAWAKQKRIPMGPGRGSAAGSIVAYLTGITDIEPLRFHLFFERFINPERISYPDIDVDICMDRRQEVIDYVVEKYGKEKVAQIITFGTMKAKMAIKDISRTLGVPLAKANEIAALIPEDPTMTLEKAFQMEPQLEQLMQQSEEARAILEMAKRLEGSIRNASTHAAGIIISAEPITDYVPTCVAKDSSMAVTQFSMKPVELVGMLKIDFLGLKTLTAIQLCVDMIAQPQGPVIDWSNLPLDNRPAFALLTQGKTQSIFQLESGGMQDLAKQLHIDNFEEIIAVGALYRPGPMDMIPSFCNRKHGREEIEIDHPLMKEILGETYGVMVYQEQVMQIASALAGYSLGEGDVLRRAMGKKDKTEMARQREKFLSGCAQKGIGEELSTRIFDKIEKFASYGFNKSHAAAYAYLSYATAYFKANYPKEWMAASMTCDRDDTSKLAKLIGEALAMQIAMLPPDVNCAGATFAATKEGIRFAMSGIKGVGAAVVDEIIAERKRGGPFTTLYDFIERADKTKVGKKAIELLVEAGSFDTTGWSRDAMLMSVEAMHAESSRAQKESSRGILNLFSLLDEKKPFQEPPRVVNPSSKAKLLLREKELLGFYLTGHPMDSYKHVLQRLSCVPFGAFESLEHGAIVRAAFIVETLNVKISNKSQKKFAILTISDGLLRFELPIWSDMYEEKMPLLRENQLLYGVLSVERQGSSTNLIAKFIDDLTSVDEAKITACEALYDKLVRQGKMGEPKWKAAKAAKEKQSVAAEKEPPATLVTLRLDADTTRLSHVLRLKQLFREHSGKSPVELQFYRGEKRIGSVYVDAKWGVRATPLFLAQVKQLVNLNM